MRYWAVGMLWRAISCLAKSLEPSIWAAAFVGAEGLDAGRGEVVDESFDQGDFRADERPVVLVVLHEADEGGVV